ncbi:MAG: TolC family outer membrane protein [Betaproteobacteria bacterium]|nr:TolC family outer membrane protein [Betaproteobacteria bacterium]
MKKFLGCVFLFISSSFGAMAEAADFLKIYRLALENDPQYLAARHQLDAGREKENQGLAGLLPSIGISGNSQWNDIRNAPRYDTEAVRARYNSNAWTLNLSQPIFRWQNIASYRQGKFQAAQAEVQFVQARQNLILRAAQAYFDLLYAEENLVALGAQKTAISEQLERAKKNFEVGVSTIVDTHEAQSRYDLAMAQWLAGQSDLEIKKRALEVIVGPAPGALAKLREKAELPPPQPNAMNPWVEAAERDNTTVQIRSLDVEIATQEVEKNRAGHYPTVDAIASVGKSAQSQALLSSGGFAPGYDNTTGSIGLQLNIPIFQGGYVSSRTRETAANTRAAEQMLEAARREAAQSARQAYLNVNSGIAQIAAYRAAVVSSRSSWESNKLGYEVGVRINIDVLNAEQQLYLARRDLARAWYDTLLAQLQLKFAVGALDENDVGQINGLLED